MSLSHRIKKMLITTTAMAGILVAGAGAASAATVSVHSGDTLSSISRQNNVSLSSLEQVNNLSNDSILQVGQQLTLPGTTNGQTASAQTTQSTNYTAQAQQPQTQTTSTQTQAQPQTQTPQANTASNSGGSASSWIASHESGGSYTAQNGQYYGKYQLDKSYLNGDYSAANQERVATQYAQSRYGSWSNAQAFWQSHGWW
ncbi:peptidase M23 [Philodulcilactobacillus myokoensis]|uniref:Peptidase M23 n=1 Tax=Philodulcilactobacillus myokoensis TaxID=2929573 RepID=A0A9W6B0B7_9LACO|nr:LysM domain-containing protein [Philodulcilactobacillus myokoensis]GLB46230.1 peptidase M23 [Philodulcilactobacillus myokoensis]